MKVVPLRAAPFSCPKEFLRNPVLLLQPELSCEVTSGALGVRLHRPSPIPHHLLGSLGEFLCCHHSLDCPVQPKCWPPCREAEAIAKRTHSPAFHDHLNRPLRPHCWFTCSEATMADRM